MKRFFGSAPFRILLAATAIGLTFDAAPTSSVQGAVVISDGFGDADVNNNGTPLEMADVDVSGAGDSAVAPYVPVAVSMVPGGTPPVFPAGTMVNEVTAVENAADVGIKWFSMGPWSGSTPPLDPTVSVHIINDAAGALPETNNTIGFHHAAANATQFAEAINSGLALAAELKGRGNVAGGFFGREIALGPAVNDEVKVSFDFRVWYSAANFNTNALNHVPQIGDFRFGLFQDTDNQLGMANSIAGAGGTPATWGQENGNFRGDNGTVGANGDHGWFVRVPIDDPATTNFNQPSQNIARINEETNEGAAGDLRIMNGATDFVADPMDNPGTTMFPEFGIGIDKVFNLSLSLKRFDDPATAETNGDTIFATVTITERTSGTTWSFGDYERVGVAAGGDPDGGIESDSWDYFAMSTGGSSSSDDFDWLIDNFKVEIFGSNVPAGEDADFDNDGDVDGSDFLVFQRNLGNGAATNTTGDADGNGIVNAADLSIWRTKFGMGGASSGAAAAVPEPASGLLALAAVVAALRGGGNKRCSRTETKGP